MGKYTRAQVLEAAKVCTESVGPIYAGMLRAYAATLPEQCQAIVEDKGYPTNPYACSRSAAKDSRYCTQHARRTHPQEPSDGDDA